MHVSAEERWRRRRGDANEVRLRKQEWGRRGQECRGEEHVAGGTGVSSDYSTDTARYGDGGLEEGLCRVQTERQRWDERSTGAGTRLESESASHGWVGDLETWTKTSDTFSHPKYVPRLAAGGSAFNAGAQ